MIKAFNLSAANLNLARKLARSQAERDKLRAQVADLKATLKHVQHENDVLHREYGNAARANHALAAAHTDMVQRQSRLAA